MTTSRQPTSQRPDQKPSLALLVTRIVLAAVLAILSFGAATIRAHAQAPATGQWQGTTAGEKPERVVLLLPEVAAKRGFVYLLDEENSSSAHATSTLEVSKTAVSFSLSNIEATFSGAFSADHASLTGTWTVRGKSVPLNLAHVAGDAAWEIPKISAAMDPAADPSFEVATIRLADPDLHNTGFQQDGTRSRAHNQNLETIIDFAYNIHRTQIIDAPSWIKSERWEISGISDTPGDPSLAQFRNMFRKLLADRFGLVLEEQAREIPVYALVKTKDAPKLTPSATGNTLPNVNGNGNNGVQSFVYENISLDEFASELSYWEDRPVVNKTDLSGRFDFRLSFTRNDAPPAIDSNAPPVLFTAIQEQLALKVEATHLSTKVYVVKHVEHPTAN
ncbi:soil-associated protein, TIGR03435 family [Bryocella elongata]|uniref:Soil-associated protein, TIGR03435 family n=1 Tax=Bryocella elongata TaxID=863522 RepID=A0A1H6AGQ1_9BACT|nr:TIGR03435 family protein [Bryocella elongata]SEG47943.1 soil-associated protein, TIGR03435 family [Bryocella elongata]